MKLLRATSALAVLAVGIPSLLGSSANADTSLSAICAPLSHLAVLPVFATTPSLKAMKDGWSSYNTIETAFQKAYMAVPFDSANRSDPGNNIRLYLFSAYGTTMFITHPEPFALRAVALAAAKGDSRQALNIWYKFLAVRSISVNQNILKEATTASPFVAQTCNLNIVSALSPSYATTTTTTSTLPASTTTSIAPTTAQVASGYATSLAYGHALMKYITAHRGVSIRSAIAATPRGGATSVSVGKRSFYVKYVDANRLTFCVKLIDPSSNSQVVTQRVASGSTC